MAEMTAAAKAARNAYRREWYKRNKEKVKKQQADYWERKAQEAAEEESEDK